MTLFLNTTFITKEIPFNTLFAGQVEYSVVLLDFLLNFSWGNLSSKQLLLHIFSVFLALEKAFFLNLCLLSFSDFKVRALFDRYTSLKVGHKMAILCFVQIKQLKKLGNWTRWSLKDPSNLNHSVILNHLSDVIHQYSPSV